VDGCISVVRMNLERESFGWKNKFDEKREARFGDEWLPRHSAGISVQAAPSVFPVNGPEAMRQSTPVSQASPSGSVRLDFSGKSGASERAPQRRGLKMGTMRVGVGLTA